MQKSRILVVDDDPSVRKFVTVNLEARNYQVISAVDGDEALRQIEKEQPDLVLLDIMMPRLDGLTVCRRIREKSAVPIMIISARDSEDDTVKCLDSGADDYLTKPFSLKELLARIKAILRTPS
jgi:DNA-binding response OmpR family regulator